MNYKMLFIVTLITGCLQARHYESVFSQWGRYLDEMDENFDRLHTRMHMHKMSSPTFALEKSEKAVSITIDTGKKVTGEDISITHKNNRVSVEVAGLEHTLSLKLESGKYALGISLCSQTNQEKKNDQEFSAYQGSSCMQQIMSVGVDLAGITAEYSGTKLVLSVPLVKEEQGKKISVVMKDSTTVEKATNSAIAHQSDGRKRTHEK